MKGHLSVPLHVFYDKARYCVQYIDYPDDQWTAPVMLTEERAKKFCDDLSVKRVKIIGDSFEFTLDMI